MKRRISVFLLALCMALMLVPAVALAEGDATAASPNDAVYVSASGDDANDGTEAAPYKTIAKAYAEVEDGGTIRLLSNIKTEGKLVLAQGKSVTIEGEAGDGAPVITCAPASSDLYALEVGSERDPEAPSSVTLRNATIDAEAQDLRCVRVCPGAILTLDSGATVRNGRAVHQDGTTGTSDWGGGIVVDGGAKLVMNDGSAVTGCSAEMGGGVYLSGEMVMNGGTVSDNTAVGDSYTIDGQSISTNAHGGGVLIRANRADYDESNDTPAKMTMNGGSISDNAATSDTSAFGGGIAILGTWENGQTITNEFAMNGGEISGNKASYGGGISVYVHDNYWQGNTNIKISGGARITDNHARTRGGGICLFGNNSQNYNSVVEMAGGEISGNTTNGNGGGVYLQAFGDELYMTGGSVSNNKAAQGGGISINSGLTGDNTDAVACLLGGTVSGNVATDGYPTLDDASERAYYGNAIAQDGILYLDGVNTTVEGDIRLGCTVDTSDNSIDENRVVSLVNGSDSMNDFELSSLEGESIDGRDVVVPASVSYGGKVLEVDDAEPYMTHFTHNHKGIIASTLYTNLVPGATAKEKSLVLYGESKLYTVTYTDGVDGEDVFEDQVTDGLRFGVTTPAFNGTPTRDGYVFKGWEPSVAQMVTGDAVYVAQWERVAAGESKPADPANPSNPAKPGNDGKLPQTGDTSLTLVAPLAVAGLAALGAAFLARRRA